MPWLCHCANKGSTSSNNSPHSSPDSSAACQMWPCKQRPNLMLDAVVWLTPCRHDDPWEDKCQARADHCAIAKIVIFVCAKMLEQCAFTSIGSWLASSHAEGPGRESHLTSTLTRSLLGDSLLSRDCQDGQTKHVKHSILLIHSPRVHGSCKCATPVQQSLQRQAHLHSFERRILLINSHGRFQVGNDSCADSCLASF